MKFGRAAVSLLTVVTVAVTGAASGDDQPWWDAYPVIVETGDLEESRAHHATAGMNGTDSDPGWGTYGQVNLRRPSRRQDFHDAGLKCVSYYETYGQTYCFVAELGEQGDQPYRPITWHHWGWQLYSGGPIRWVGAHNFFDDEAFARPYTRTHPEFGGPAMTYPDGTAAAGYDGPAADPRNSRVYDAGGSKDVYGNLVYETGYNPAVNAIDEDTGEPAGPLDGLIEVDGRYAGLFLFARDAACPMWAEYAAASAGLAASHGLDGMWSDNYSPWDNLGYPPIRRGFGDWSVASFRDHLKAEFTPEELAALGVDDADAFDAAAYLRAKADAWAGQEAGPHDAAWRDPRWLDDPLWRAYLIHKRRTGTAALEAYYAGIKAAAAAQGKPDFFIMGNDIPFYSLGWCRGTLDMVSTEMTPGWHMGAGSRGIMLPPRGKFAPVYRLAKQHAKSRLVNVWFYVSHGKASPPELADILHYEMLANHALPMFHPHNPRVAGTLESNRAFGAFVETVRPVFGQRRSLADIGVYYSSSSVLTEMTPGGFVDFDRQPHQFACWGVGTALTELQQPYRFIPEWQLDAEALEGLRLLIVPSAAVFDPAHAEDVLQPWLDAGGHLLITGESGVRLPETGNFAMRPGGSCLDDLTGDIARVEEPIALDYYLNELERPALLEAWRQLLGDFAGPSLVALPETPMPTVGVNLYADPAKKRLFVDVNNYDIEGEAGPITPAPSFETDIAAPPWLVNTQVRTLSPDGEIPAAATPLEGGRLTLTLGAVARYASVALEADTDGDGLSDAVEIDGEYGPATDPDHPDTDGDGLSDGEELREYGTDPANPDTDGDGHGDGAEVSAGADPTDPDDTPGPGLTLTGGAGAAAAAFLAGAAAYRLRQRAS